MEDPPRDRRILVYLHRQWTDYPNDGEFDETGWFTAQFEDEEWRIGLDRMNGCSWVKQSAILAWQDLPPPPKGFDLP